VTNGLNLEKKEEKEKVNQHSRAVDDTRLAVAGAVLGAAPRAALRSRCAALRLRVAARVCPRRPGFAARCRCAVLRCVRALLRS